MASILQWLKPSQRETSSGTDITKVDIVPPGFKKGEKLAFYLDNVFTKEEYDEWIQLAEDKGFQVAKINSGTSEYLVSNYRKGHRCIIDSFEMRDKVWEKIAMFIPTNFKTHDVVGLNERFRFLRYDKGDFFKPHFDGSYVRENGKEETFITIQIYLNEGFSGGSTTFLSNDKRVECVPKIGRVLVFEHHLLHEGSELFSGRKYAIRSDILYKL
ncbi:uncharacterized protein LOC117124130 [Anneissia japonica]|uniref:uncharacterized protein LOC117124130 n=1 Tax=Anneissia japonica TaxID=1529436 RepID=UPI0014255B68|nr:uncharacterized protein LOC117124130 [Anneissia japonica]